MDRTGKGGTNGCGGTNLELDGNTALLRERTDRTENENTERKRMK